MRALARWSPVLVQRAVSEDPRWTRAMGDFLARPQGNEYRLAEMRTVDYLRVRVVTVSRCLKSDE
jgi:hypothetical protein